jgi:rubrerythrin
MDKIEEAIYRHEHICTLCNGHYGSDYDADDGVCPVCQERTHDRHSRFDKTRPQKPQKPLGYKKRGGM